jgi:general secretion pathway protein E
MVDHIDRDSLSHRFCTLVSIDFCRTQRICVVDAGDTVSETVLSESSIICLEETKSFVIDAARRLLGHYAPVRTVASDELILLIDQQFERFRMRGEVFTKEYHEKQDAALESVSLEGDLLQDQSQTPVIEMVNRILFEAIQQKASDIHFQPLETTLVARFRIDGVLFDYQFIPKTSQEEILARIKVAGRMDIAEKRLPQDGRATVRIGSRVIDLRIASLPSGFGERIVVRLLEKTSKLFSLVELGMEGETLARYRNAIHVEHGMLLVTGPTGSGKSTTLYATLKELDTKEYNVITLEDPIEYQLEGISQTQINLKKGMSFASGLRSVLRQDPDIIMVGEIRDAETAVMSVQAALTGHLVFSTLHTNDASSAVTRMLDLGIEPYLLSSSLNAVLAQRLVRKLCFDCRAYSDLDKAGAGEWQAVGCDLCRGTGYRGRLGIYELLIIDEELRSMISRREHSSQIRDHAVKNGMDLLEVCGTRKIASGETTPIEVQRVTSRL